MIEANTGLLIAKALSETLSAAWVVGAAMKSCVRLLHIINDFSGNHVAEEVYSQAGNASVGRLHLICEVHRLHAIANAMFQLSPDFISGLVKTCVALRSGQMLSSRRTLRHVIRQ